MKIFYCGCKPIMRAGRMSFPRSNKAVEVSDEVGTKLLAIDGFYPSMNEDAKKELTFNVKREKTEKEKLKTGITTIQIPDESSADEIKSLKAQLEEAIDGSQLGSLIAENKQLKSELKDCHAKLTAVEMTSKVGK